MTRRGILGAGIGSMCAALGACNIFAEPSYKFRLTVNVKTPEGMRSGSSVCEVKADRGIDLSTGGQTQGAKMRGEAAIVELPKGRNLIALLLTNNPLLGDIGKASLKTLDGEFDYKRYDATRRIADSGSIGPIALPETDLPILVTLKDPSNPESLEVVEPADLGSTFGVGHELESITVETTQEPITNRVMGFFPWLLSVRSTLKPSTTIYVSEKPLAEKIRPQHFRMAEFGSPYILR